MPEAVNFPKINQYYKKNLNEFSHLDEHSWVFTHKNLQLPQYNNTIQTNSELNKF